MKLNVRKAVADDILGIRELFDQNYRQDYFLPESHIRRSITGEVEARFGKQRNPHNVFIALDDNVIIGMALVNQSGCLNNLLVHKKYRGVGVGSVLLQIANPRTIRCKIDNSDGNPMSFYHKWGYYSFGQFDLWGDLPLQGRKKNIQLMSRVIRGDKRLDESE